jgi:hypothetical protein
MSFFFFCANRRRSVAELAIRTRATAHSVIDGHAAVNRGKRQVS